MNRYTQNMNPQTINKSLKSMRRSDWLCKKVFGAKKHRYKLNSCISESEVRSFESEHGIELPAQYRSFITQIGNGGVGPNYGLFPLAKTLEHASDKEYGEFSLDKEFPHKKHWNMQCAIPTQDIPPERMQEYETFENEYFKNHHLNGSIAISDAGCGYIYLLVVSGDQAGTVWYDARVSDGGISPSTKSFNEWYGEWLNTSMEELKV